MKKIAPPLQVPVTWPTPKTRREVLAEALRLAELEYRAAQEAVRADDSNENRARYAKALADYDRLQGAFPFTAAGLTDETV